MAILLIVLSTAAFAPASEPAVTSGLRGVVMRGPTTPVCREDDPCEKPAAGLVLVFSRSGSVAARVTTTRAGTYVVRLRAGWYTVTTPGRGVGSGITPRAARVLAGRIRRVDFHLDTGIQ